MLGSHRLVAITEIRHIATNLYDGCLCTMHWTAVLLKLKLVPRLWQYYIIWNTQMIVNVLEYMCAKNYRNSSDKAIAKIKRCGFLPNMAYIQIQLL